MKSLRTLLAALLALGLGAGIATFTEGEAEAQWGYSNTSVLSGLLTTDGTDVTLTSGQFLLPDGTSIAPGSSFSSDSTSGTFLDGSALGLTITGDDHFFVHSLPAASGNGSLVAIGEQINAMEAGNTVNILNVLDSSGADHTGGTVNGINIAGITGDAQADEYAIRIGTGWDAGILFPDGTAAFPSFAFASDDTAGFYWDQSNGRLRFVRESTSTVEFRGSVAAGGSGFVFNVGSGLTLNNMNGSDTVRGEIIQITNGNHTGTGNTLSLLHINNITGDANSDLNAINIGALTGTTGAAGELEYAIQVEGGWDAAFRDVGVAFANLQPADNGSFVYCTNCDPSTSPCASSAGQTGAWAFRQNGAWECPIP